jgi:hypothetical protein
MVVCDFLVVVTASFRFLVRSDGAGLRRILYFNVTVRI